MTGTTNPYQTWLGLHVASRPDCYTLLGLPLYESDTGKILVASQNALSRASIPMSPADEPARQTLVSEIQTAQNCLLDPAQKQAYDQQLQAYYSGQSSPAPASAAPSNAAPATAAPVASAVASPATSSPVTSSAAAPSVAGGNKSAARSLRQRSRNSSLGFYGGIAVLLLLGVAGGGVYYYIESNKPPEQIVQTDLAPPSDDDLTDDSANDDSAPDGSSRKSPQPRGNRPSADDLANSIGGLGNPDEAMDGMPEDPGMSAPPAKPMATPEQQRQLDTALQAAWTAVGQRNFGQASVALEEVRPLPKTEEGEKRFAGVDQFVQDLMAFQKALSEGLETLQADEQLAVGSTTFTVNTTTDDRIVIRVAGQNKAYDKNTLPEGLKRAIAKSRLKGDDPQKQRIEASYLLLSPLADAEYIRKQWMQAGADADTLAALETGKQKYFPAAPTAAIASTDTAAPATEMTSTGDGPPPLAAMPGASGADDALQRAQQLGAALQQARTLLTERKVEQAQQVLAGAADWAELPEHQEKLARVELLVDLVDQFWTAVRERLGSLEADTELDVNGMLTRIVEASPDRLVIRLQGENRRYTLADLPAGLAKFLAEQQLGAANAETKRITGAFVLVTPEGGKEKALEDWNAARQQGADVASLLALLEDDYQLGDDLIEQAPVPSESDIAAPAAKFMETWSSKISSAQRIDDHAELGRQMLDAALGLPNGTPQQFAAFRYALAEAARGGDFATCTAIINGWHKRFAIDEAQWHLKALQLAANSSNAAAVHAGVVKHALEQIPRLRAAGQNAIADAMQAIAESSAQKARDKALQDAVKQLAAAS